MRNITDAFIEKVQRMNLEELDESVVREAKKAVLDTIACMIVGTNSDIGKATMEVFSEFGGKEEAMIVGRGKKYPAAISAYINAETCVGPDLSDNYQPDSIIISHPGEAVVPPVLAVAERENATLGDFLVAVIAGYELAGRYARAIEPRRPEVYSFSTHYTIAGALGCAKLLRFDDRRMKTTLGVAGALGSLPVTSPMWGFRERPASWHRDMPGHSSFSAVLASQYAQTDFQACRRLLDPEIAFYKLAGSENYDPNLLVENWGGGWVIENITYKKIPSCYFQQTGVEMVRLLVEEHSLGNDDIAAIDIYQPKNFAANFIEYPPQTSVDTASSLRYLISAYLLNRKIGPDWYEKYREYLVRRDFQEIADKVTIHKDEDLQRLFDTETIVKGRARLQTRDGKVFEKELRLEQIKGNFQNNPMAYEEIVDKFMDLSAPVVGKANARKFVDVLESGAYDGRMRAVVEVLGC